MPEAPVRVVCFDLGGVVVRICNSWEQGCAAAGLDVRSGPVTPDSIDEKTRIVHALTTGAIDGPAFFRTLSEGVGGLYSPQEFERVHRAWILGEYEGVRDIITRLRDLPSATVACLSNTNHVHWDQLMGLDGDRYPAFDALERRHASHLLRCAKPDERIYRAFEREIGARGAEVLFFDDKRENIDTAQAIGWRARRIDPGVETAPQIAETLRGFGVL
ncbi:MAG: HAD-IA family hydrolase [Phycisphaeraceae bacterium]|nr:HAD-IA family hydrolase [Phycisphaeraceae bacterium]